jgi:TolB-like protein/tetratricopeptide (TPR) repeat protein
MGEVYRAHDSRLDRDVAVKTLPRESESDPENRRRFEREARAAASLGHPNVVSLFDVGEQDGIRYVVTELVDGQTLRARLSHGPLPATQAAEIGAQIARGLAAAHEKGLVHRDLKPENVMLTPAGTVKILDFGLARRTARPVLETDEEPTQSAVLSEVGSIAGTVGYMSPEQVRGEGLDPRSDVFSLGTVLYEMLTGQRPFRAASTVETLNAILKEEPPLAGPSVSSLSPEIGRILSRCLAKRREDRYHSAADLAHDLRAVAAASPVSSPAGVEPIRSPARGRALALVALAAAVLAVAGVLTLRARRAGPGLPRTLAVLPFRTIGVEPAPHFGLGLADSVIGRLASLRELTVRPTSAISRFEAAPADAMDAGKQLDVEAVLEGTFQKLEGTTRVSFQLTDVSRGAIVWTDYLDLAQGQLFQIQDQIAQRLVERLSLELDGTERRALGGSQSVPDDVMEEYLAVRARLSLAIRMSADERRELLGRLDRILERAPNFAKALGARAYARAWFNFQSPSPEGQLAATRDAERALVLDPDLAEPRIARAVAHWSFAGGWNFVDAVRELKAVIKHKPGLDLAHLDLARILVHYGWMEEARAELDIARRISPTSSEILLVEAHRLWLSGELKEALAMYHLMPQALLRERAGGRYQILQLRLVLEDPRPVLAEVQDWVAEREVDTQLPQALLALARVRNGRRDISDLEKEIASADPTTMAGHFHHVDHVMAEVYAQKGDTARAIQALRRAATTGMPCLSAFDTDPLLAPIRASADYATFRRDLVELQAELRRRVQTVP